MLTRYLRLPSEIALISLLYLNIDVAKMELITYFLKICIEWTIPTIALAITALIFGKAISSGNNKMEKKKVKSPLEKLFSGGAQEVDPLDAPVEEFLKVERINDKLYSYLYSLEKAIVGKDEAIRDARRKVFERKYGDEVAALDDAQLQVLRDAEEKFAKASQKVTRKLDDAARELRATAVKDGAKRDNPLAGSSGSGSSSGKPQKLQVPMQKEEENEEEGYTDEGNDDSTGSRNPITSFFTSLQDSKRVKTLYKTISECTAARARAEGDYLATISSVLGPVQRGKLQSLLMTRESPSFDEFTSFQQSPLLPAIAQRAQLQRPHTFVLDFPGDVTASQVVGLREEITAILKGAKSERGDGVLVILNSGGGTVTGYGLAAAQLMRLKGAGLPLTVCIEQVAASGGYMMACTADKIIASPFALLGSIGVISELPNVYERLKREGIEFQTITAGKYKRTLTPTKKPTQEDIKKTTEDIANVLILFKDFVAKNRPQLDIEEVATGETWFGPDALSRNLCDELNTVDDVLLGLADEGHELFSVTYKPPATGRVSLLKGLGAVESNALVARALLGVLQGVGTSDDGGSPLSVTGLSRMAESAFALDTNDPSRRFLSIDDSQELRF